MSKAKKTHCPRGHPYSGDNLYFNPGRDSPVCLACKRQRKADAKGAPLLVSNKHKTHCDQGHPLAGENLYVTSLGGRQCRTCDKENHHRRHQIRYAEDVAYRERIEENNQRWQLENPERLRIIRNLNQSRRRGAPGHCSSEQLQARIDFFGGKCWMCGAEWEHIDHVKPLSKGGSNWPANLRPACGPCNLRKSNQWPYDPCETASISA